MEIKKTPKANLEKEISLSYLMGIVLGLAVLFVGFEWGSTDVTVATGSGLAAVLEEEDIEITRQEEEIVIPEPEPIVEVAPEVLNVVSDEVEVDNNAMLSTEDDASHAQVSTYVASSAIVEEEEEEDENFIFMTVEKMPEFPGGDAALMKWLNDNIKYPTVAAENGISGRVTCQFTVNADGTVTDVEVMRSVDPNLDREALRVMRMVPKFKPGEQRGKPVRVKYSVPVRFTLQN